MIQKIDWIDFCPLAAFEDTPRQIKRVQGVEIAVIRQAGQFYAFENSCPHEHLPFAQDVIVSEDNQITCCHHGAQFCLKTGAVTAPPAFDDLTLFDVRIIDNQVQICTHKTNSNS